MTNKFSKIDQQMIDEKRRESSEDKYAKQYKYDSDGEEIN